MLKSILSRFSKDDWQNHVYALILAGGGGTRLWPRSREKSPKQFLKLFGKETLTQLTADRLSKILPWERIYVVTVSEEYKSEIVRELPKIPKDNILVEPARRETGPAHGLGASVIYSKDKDAVIITESADRMVKPVPRYLKILKEAARVAFENKYLIAMGVEARYPNTAYGHIKRGKKVNLKSGDVHFYKLDKFVEKPPIELAQKYTSSGNYYWNAGQFVWRADSLLGSLKKYEPKIYAGLTEIMESLGTSKEAGVVKRVYETMPKIGIDYAVAEKDPNFLVVEGDFFWTDIGDWREVWANSKKDNQSNVVISGDAPGGDVITIDTSDSIIHSNGRTIAVVGLDNMVVVDTKDALLIVSKSKAQSVKKVVEKLKEDSRRELL